MPRRTHLSIGILVPVVWTLAACGGDDSRPAAGPLFEMRTDTIGDTVVVHTVSGSVWGGPAELVTEVSIGELDAANEYIFGAVGSLAIGPDGEIFVMDRQLPELRVYEPDGTYRTTIGRGGEGPGEYKRPDGGMVVVGDRLVVRDPGNGRMAVYALDGEPLETWLTHGGFSTSAQMRWDRAGNVYSPTIRAMDVPVDEWERVLVQYRADGTSGDTLSIPEATLPDNFVEGRSENSSSRTSVPFTPSDYAVFSPEGYFVHAVSTRYGVALLKPDGPLLITRAYDPVPVQPREASSARERIERNFRNNFPGWSWNGPEIPPEKPPYRGVSIGTDGKLWVLVSQPGVEVDNPFHDPQDEDSTPTLWRTPAVYDVFETDGRYLGPVAMPEGFQTFPEPVFGPDWIVATTRDDFDVQRVVRFRVRPPASGTD